MGHARRRRKRRREKNMLKAADVGGGGLTLEELEAKHAAAVAAATNLTNCLRPQAFEDAAAWCVELLDLLGALRPAGPPPRTRPPSRLHVEDIAASLRSFVENRQYADAATWCVALLYALFALATKRVALCEEALRRSTDVLGKSYRVDNDPVSTGHPSSGTEERQHAAGLARRSAHYSRLAEYQLEPNQRARFFLFGCIAGVGLAVAMLALRLLF